MLINLDVLFIAYISACYALLYHTLCFKICHYELFCMALCCICEINLIDWLIDWYSCIRFVVFVYRLVNKVDHCGGLAHSLFCDGMSKPISSTTIFMLLYIAVYCFVCVLFCNLLFSLIATVLLNKRCTYRVVLADSIKWSCVSFDFRWPASYWVFTRSDRRTDRSVRLVGPTGQSDDQSRCSVGGIIIS